MKLQEYLKMAPFPLQYGHPSIVDKKGKNVFNQIKGNTQESWKLIDSSFLSAYSLLPCTSSQKGSYLDGSREYLSEWIKKRLTVFQAESPVALHSISVHNSGKLTEFIDLSLDSDKKQEQPQVKESLHAAWESTQQLPNAGRSKYLSIF